MYSAGNIDAHGRHAPLKAMATGSFDGHGFVYRPTKISPSRHGTSPDHEAGIPTNWYAESWNDGPPGRYSGLEVVTTTIVTPLKLCQGNFTTTRVTEGLAPLRHKLVILSMRHFSACGVVHMDMDCIATP